MLGYAEIYYPKWVIQALFEALLWSISKCRNKITGVDKVTKKDDIDSSECGGK